MNSLTLLPPSDPLLNQRSKEVLLDEISTPEIQNLIAKMYDIAFGEQKDIKRPYLVGLAAPQIGSLRRIILVDIAATGHVLPEQTSQLEIFINPEIVWRSEELVLWREGCFSTNCICGIVPRAYRIRLRASDSDGKLIEKELIDYVARIFQHEIDHLDGIRFPDRITNDTLLHWVQKEEAAQYRKTWPIWEKLCPRDVWISLKEGKSHRNIS